MYTEAIEQLRSEGAFGDITLWHNGRQASNYAGLDIRDDDANISVKPSELELTDAQTRWLAAQAIRDSDAQAKNITRDDILEAIRDTLLDPTPNWGSLYSTVKSFTDSHPKLLQAIDNRISWDEIADSYTLDTSTTPGKAQWLRLAFDVMLIFMVS